MSKNKLRLHTHPKMEDDCSLEPDHVIIDRDIFDALFRIHGQYVVQPNRFVTGENDERQLTVPDFKKRCQAEATRDVVFLFQIRRWHDHALPEGYHHDGEGVIKEDGTGEYLTYEQLSEMDAPDGEACIKEHWTTESVWLSREEGEAYGKAHNYRWPDGWRVYGVPSEGKLAELVRNT